MQPVVAVAWAVAAASLGLVQPVVAAASPESLAVTCEVVAATVPMPLMLYRHTAPLHALTLMPLLLRIG